jgi:ATP-dependent protease ClpP protease subunit
MPKTLLVNNEMLLYGDVGDPWGWGDGFTPTDVAQALAEHGHGDITVRINSGGGIAFDGMAIHSILKSHFGKVTTVVDGIAASAASLIAMAGTSREMRQGAMMMIHDPSAITLGTEAHHRAAADKLGKIADNYASVYAMRAGKEKASARATMKAETWLGADEAIAEGFADKTIDEPALEKASFDYRIYAKAPRSLPVRTRLRVDAAATAAFPIDPKGPIQMPQAQTAEAHAEKPWAANFYASAAKCGLPLEKLNEIVAAAGDKDAARDALIDAMAATQDANKPRGGPSLAAHGATFDNPNFLSNAAADALYCRMSGKAPDGAAREWMGQSLMDIGRAVLAANGQRAKFGSKHEIANSIMSYRGYVTMAGAHSTSDFPNLLQLSGTRILMDAYQAAATPLKTLATRRDAPDFRALSMLRLSEGPELLKVPEGADVTYGSMKELKEGFSVATFARKFALTRQALINDDLGAFSDQAKLMGRGAAQMEANQMVLLLTANSGNGALMSDGDPLYHADHGNKAASGAALSIDALNTGRQAMRQQTGADGKTLIDVPPRYLLVGAALEGAAEQFISAYYPAKAADVNPFAQKLLPLVEPRLTGNAWRLFTDPATVPALAFAYLNGQSGPIIEAQEGWNVLGIEFRAIEDFGCGAIDWRATYLNAGA